MSQYAMICPPLPSHIYTVAALGRELARRGHSVTMIGLPDAKAQIEAEHLQYHPIGETGHPVGEVARFRKQLAETKGIAGLRLAMAAVRRMNETLFAELPGILRHIGADALIADQAEAAAGTVAERAGLPWITVCNALPIHREPLLPPYFTSWQYRPDSFGRLRNFVGYAGFDVITASIRKGVQLRRSEWKLPLYRHPDEVNSPVLQLIQTVPEFDFPRAKLPPVFHYTGPFRRESHKKIEFPWHRLTGRPLVYASMGTLQTRLPAVFTAIAEACRNIRAQLVLSLGNGFSAEEVGTLPGSPIVVDFAPQFELLQRADVFITHGGLNSVQESIMAGVPAITIPITSDQGGVAARVTWTGAGEMIRLGQLSAARLQAALQRVLREPTYKANVERLRRVMLSSGGVELAADLTESALKQYRTVPAPDKAMHASRQATETGTLAALPH